MNEQRHRWIEQMVRRDNRIMDVNINASLQNGTAFFASASLIALGAALSLLRSTDDGLHLLSEMPFGLPTTRLAWEIKVLGLAVIFGPLLGVAIFTFVMMTFMRVDPRALRSLIRHPAPLILTCACLILIPAAVGYAVV